jgi:hypothetical protein
MLLVISDQALEQEQLKNGAEVVICRIKTVECCISGSSIIKELQLA